MKLVVPLACAALPLFAGCAMFHSDPAPPAPTLVGIPAQNAAWQEGIMRTPEGGAPTFKPLIQAQNAVHKAQAQPQVKRYDANDLSQAQTALAKAQSGWNHSIATDKEQPISKLAAIADNAHRARRLAEIARYTAQRERNLKRLAAVSRQLQQAQQQAKTRTASLSSGNSLIGKKVIPDQIGKLAFESDTAKLTTASHAVIKRLAALLQQHPEYGIAIFSFTDNSAPSDSRLNAFIAANQGLAQQVKTHADKVKAYNLALSSARARDIGVLLVHHGISPHRIGARGFGEAHPVASNATAAGRRANRRIEAFIVPAPKNNGDSNS